MKPRTHGNMLTVLIRYPNVAVGFVADVVAVSRALTASAPSETRSATTARLHIYIARGVLRDRLLGKSESRRQEVEDEVSGTEWRFRFVKASGQLEALMQINRSQLGGVSRLNQCK